MRSAPLGTPRTASRLRGSSCRRQFTVWVTSRRTRHARRYHAGRMRAACEKGDSRTTSAGLGSHTSSTVQAAARLGGASREPRNCTRTKVQRTVVHPSIQPRARERPIHLVHDRCHTGRGGGALGSTRLLRNSLAHGGRHPSCLQMGHALFGDVRHQVERQPRWN